jgi:hypothetical protein
MTLGLAHFVSVEQVYYSSSGHAVDAGMGNVDENASVQGVTVIELVGGSSLKDRSAFRCMGKVCFMEVGCCG